MIDAASHSPLTAPLGVILTAGSGTRLRPITPEIPKSLIPLVDRPLLAYALEALAALGVGEIVVVVGRDDTATAQAAREMNPAATIAVQQQPDGPGDAVLCVGAALHDRPVIVWPVDTVLVGGDLLGQLTDFLASPAVAWMPLADTDRPQAMGIAVLGDGDRITDLEEKPTAPRSNLAVTGPWLLRPAVIDRLRDAPTINQRGETDLTATIAAMQAEGLDVRGRRYDGAWLDAGAAASLLAAQQTLLEAGAGGVATDAELSRCTLRPPISIGAGARLSGCDLGPYVVVGAGAQLDSVSAEQTLFAPGAHIQSAAYGGQIVARSGEASEPVADRDDWA